MDYPARPGGTPGATEGTDSLSATADAAEGHRQRAPRLAFQPGQVVQELGWDDDCDESLRAAVQETTGTGLVDDSYEDVVDAVLMWWREDDGDLVDALVDALTSLADGGVIWLLTPKAARSGHVEPADIGDAARTAGLSATSSVAAAAEWSGTRLVTPRSPRR
jgi:hypothetical protein